MSQVKYRQIYKGGYEILVDGKVVGKVSSRKRPWKSYTHWVARTNEGATKWVGQTRQGAAEGLIALLEKGDT